jgi:hypothetical protein
MSPLTVTDERVGAEQAPRQNRRRRRRARRRVVLAVAGVLLAAYVAVTIAFFVEPTLGVVAHPQVVVVLDGYGSRIPRGLAIARADHVRTVAVSWPPYGTCPAPQSGLRITCFVPNPVSTQGEARAVARLARAHHWTRLIVVVGTTQVVRARERLDRCYSGHYEFNGVDPAGFFSWIYEIAYNQAALMKALVWQRSC